MTEKSFSCTQVFKASSSLKPPIQDQSAKLLASLGLHGSTLSCHYA